MVQTIMDDKKKKCVVIDELDTLLQYDRSMLHALDSFTNSHVPIVCIGDRVLCTKVNNFFGQDRTYMCCAPSETDVCIFLKFMFGNTISCQDVLKAAEHCNGNVHRALQMLRQPCNHPISSVPESHSDAIRKVLHDDPWLHPLRFHENLIKNLNARKGKKVDKRKFYTNALHNLINWDVMMQANRDCTFALENIVAVHVRLEKFPRIHSTTTEDASDFTKMFSNLSLQKKNEKKMYTNDLSFPWTHAQIFCDYIKYR